MQASQYPEAPVVTSLGMVSPLGNGVAANWDALLARRSGIGALTGPEFEGCPPLIGGEVRLDPEDFGVTHRQARNVSRAQLLGLCAASEALEASGLDRGAMKHVGVSVGTAVGGISDFGEASETMASRGFSRISPKSVTKYPANMTAYSIAEAFGAQGYCFTLADACASGAKALHMAADAIRLGHADVMVVVATEASLTAVGLGSFYNNGALSKSHENPERISRPFDVGRDGFVMSEGAAAVVVESQASAAMRGATPLARVLGHAFANDGSNAMAPTEDGLIQADTMRLALSASGLTPSDIGLIIPHATSTDTGDRAEANSYRILWPERTPPISAIKASFGHTVGAAGLIEAIVCIQAIQTGIAPPTLNFEQADPCSEHLDIVTGPRDIDIDYAMNVSNGIGGINSVGVFGRVG